MNSFSHSYDPSSRILSIKDSTGKTLFVPKTLDGTPENWKEETKNGRTIISYTAGGETIQHTIQGNEYRTLIGSNTTPPDFRACWEKELKSNGTFEDANVCKAENFNVTPSTPPSKPETPPAPPASQPKTENKPPQPKPDPATSPAPTTTPSKPKPANPTPQSTKPPAPETEILTPSEKALVQREKEKQAKEVYGPPTPTAEEWEKHRKTNPSPKSTPVVPSTPSNPTGKPKVEVGKSFPPNLPAGVTPYHYEKTTHPDGTSTLSLKQGDKTLYERPFGESSSTNPLTHPIYRNDRYSGWISTSNKDQNLTSTIKLHPKAKHWNGSPRVEVIEQEEGKPGKTIKKSNWRGQLETIQTAKEGELKALEEKIANKKESVAQYQDQLKNAENKNDPTAIQEAKQNIQWEQDALDALLKKKKELEAAIEAEKKGGSTPTPSTTTPPVSKPWWNPLPTPTAPVLVMGVDSNGNPNDPYTGARTDTMMLMRPDTHEGDIDLVSLPRDTKVQSGGKTQKLNAAYAQGGASKTLETVQNSLGVPVDKYVAFDTKIVRDFVDAIGGVEVVIKEPLKYEDKTAGLKIDIPAGDPNNGYKVRLDGEDAERYLRYRADGKGDVGRIPRQQAFIKSALEQLKSPSVITKIPSILQAVNQNLDTNMSYPELLQYLAYASQVNPSDLDSSTLKGKPSTGGGPSYWLPDVNQPDLEPFKQK